jgi:DNA-binding IclR family transcriptional regulator
MCCQLPEHLVERGFVERDTDGQEVPLGIDAMQVGLTAIQGAYVWQAV